MKNLVDYINESKNAFDILVDLTAECIGYLYNEGVVDYNDDAINDYVSGKKEIPYKDIAKVLLTDYKQALTSELSRKLKDLEKNGPGKDKNIAYPLQDAIMMGIEKFATKL